MTPSQGRLDEVAPPRLPEPTFLQLLQSLRTNQHCGDDFNRIQLPAYAAYREAMKDDLLALPQRSGRPNDAIVSGGVFLRHDRNPRRGETESHGLEKKKKKKKLFSFDATGPTVAGPRVLPGAFR